MSLKTWIEEFYPIPASPKMSAAEACKHGILKWSGRYQKNLKKHKVESAECDVVDEHEESNFEFGVDTCALCVKYFDYAWDCAECPIVKSGNKPCTRVKSAYLKSSGENASPAPMLKVLRQALKYCEAHPEEFAD